MIQGIINISRFAYGIGGQDDTKVLAIKDADSQLTIQILMTREEWDKFAGKLRDEVIIQATEIPNDIPSK